MKSRSNLHIKKKFAIVYLDRRGDNWITEGAGTTFLPSGGTGLHEAPLSRIWHVAANMAQGTTQQNGANCAGRYRDISVDFTVLSEFISIGKLLLRGSILIILRLRRDNLI
jgi:hypothetical protein